VKTKHAGAKEKMEGLSKVSKVIQNGKNRGIIKVI
jgi:hypothetical protein